MLIVNHIVEKAIVWINEVANQNLAECNFTARADESGSRRTRCVWAKNAQ